MVDEALHRRPEGGWALRAYVRPDIRMDINRLAGEQEVNAASIISRAIVRLGFWLGVYLQGETVVAVEKRGRDVKCRATGFDFSAVRSELERTAGLTRELRIGLSDEAYQVLRLLRGLGTTYSRSVELAIQLYNSVANDLAQNRTFAVAVLNDEGLYRILGELNFPTEKPVRR